MSKSQNLVGKIFGRLTVISLEGKGKQGHLWLCKCDCGKTTKLYTGRLNSKHSTSCGCTRHEEKKQRPSPLIMQGYWSKFLYSSKYREHIVLITPKYMESLFLLQKQKCALSGLDISLPLDNKQLSKGDFTASIDRIDSNKSYEEGNVQWVHKTINFMKHTLSQDEFIKLCAAVVATKSPTLV